VAHLRKTMLEELQRRNYSDSTIRHYLGFVERRFWPGCGFPAGPNQWRMNQRERASRPASPSRQPRIRIGAKGGKFFVSVGRSGCF
jgi:hypothetical protein